MPDLRSWSCALLLLPSACLSPFPEDSDAGRPQSETGEGSEPASTCDPLRQDCPGDQACQLVGQVFACNEVGPDAAGFGEACGPFAGPCAPGLDCGSEVVLGCSDGFGCCTSFCDPAGGGNADCPNNLRCVAIYAPGNLPPETADVGVCTP